MRSHTSPKVVASETTRHLLMRRVRAREKVSGFHLSTVTSSGVAARVPRFGSCSELFKATNADCFDDVLGLGVS